MLCVKKVAFSFASSNKSRTFAVLFEKGMPKRHWNRDVVQLVVYLVWDQVVARSSRVIPTNKGRLAQLVQSVCLTSRGSAVRIRQRPQKGDDGSLKTLRQRPQKIDRDRKDFGLSFFVIRHPIV